MYYLLDIDILCFLYKKKTIIYEEWQLCQVQGITECK